MATGMHPHIKNAKMRNHRSHLVTPVREIRGSAILLPQTVNRSAVNFSVDASDTTDPASATGAVNCTAFAALSHDCISPLTCALNTCICSWQWCCSPSCCPSCALGFCTAVKFCYPRRLRGDTWISRMGSVIVAPVGRYRGLQPSKQWSLLPSSRLATCWRGVCNRASHPTAGTIYFFFFSAATAATDDASAAHATAAVAATKFTIAAHAAAAAAVVATTTDSQCRIRWHNAV